MDDNIGVGCRLSIVLVDVDLFSPWSIISASSDRFPIRRRRERCCCCRVVVLRCAHCIDDALLFAPRSISHFAYILLSTFSSLPPFTCRYAYTHFCNCASTVGFNKLFDRMITHPNLALRRRVLTPQPSVADTLPYRRRKHLHAHPGPDTRNTTNADTKTPKVDYTHGQTQSERLGW